MVNVSSGIRRRTASLVAAMVAVVASACSGQSMRDPDKNDTRELAQRLKLEGRTTESLDDAKNDKQDWLYWQAEQGGRGELRVELSKWEENGSLSALVTVLDESGKQLVEKPLNRQQDKIKEGFDVETGRKYFVRFKLVSGKGEFYVEMGAPQGPCASCTDKQDCVDNRCVDKPCGGGCPDGQTCNKDKNECVKPKEKSVSAPRPKSEPSAPATPPAEKKDTSVACSVIDARDAGGGSVLTLSAGENKGIKRGMTGSVKGVKGASFKITEVYPSRSKASCSVPASKLDGQTQATIRP